MFQVAKTPVYLWPVKIETPTETGEPVTETFLGEFRCVTTDEIEALIGPASNASMEDAVDKVFTGWRDVVDDETPFEVTPENRAALFKVPGMRSAVLAAWLESISGQAARRKN